MFPEKLTLGFEIRDKVATFVQHRILALRAAAAAAEPSKTAASIAAAGTTDAAEPGASAPQDGRDQEAGSVGGPRPTYGNCAVERANTMKTLCHYFRRGQLSKLFFLFPDPHFKAANHRCVGQTRYGCLRSGIRLESGLAPFVSPCTLSRVDQVLVRFMDGCAAFLWRRCVQPLVASDRATAGGRRTDLRNGRAAGSVLQLEPDPLQMLALLPARAKNGRSGCAGGALSARSC